MYTDSSFDLTGLKVWASHNSDPNNLVSSGPETTTATYSVETSRKTFLDSSGNSVTLLSNSSYRIVFHMTGSLKITTVSPNHASANCRLYLIYGGEKYYFTGSTLMVTIVGENSAYYAIGAEFDISVSEYINNAGTAYLSNYIQPSYNFSKVSQQIFMYDGAYEYTPGENAINNSITSGNNLQKEENKLQQDANDLQEEQNKTTNNIFSSISDFFGSFFDNLIGIFVPESGYFEDFFARLNTFFSDKLGMLYSPIELFINLLTAIQNASAADAGIFFPGLAWEEVYIIEPQTISISEIAKDFPGLQEKIYFVTDVIMVGAVVMLLQNKCKEILTT